MTTWWDWPLGRVVDLSSVASGPVVAEGGGESSSVYEIGWLPGWLVKRYKPGMPEGGRRLDRLIAMPGVMSPPDGRLVRAAIAWPAARVVDSGLTVGVVIPRAPDSFVGTLLLPSGRRANPAPLEIDWLCSPDEVLHARGLRVPTGQERHGSCWRIATIADLLARHGLVYGDWSYSNAFWNPDDGSVYVIDMDSCGFGARPWVQQNDWRDPLVAEGERMDGTTDRYRVGLLVARCLTGTRDLPSVLTALDLARETRLVEQTLWDMIYVRPLGDAPTAAERAKARGDRPTVSELAEVLSAGRPTRAATARPLSTLPAGANVTGWVQVRTGAAQTPSPAAPREEIPAQQMQAGHVRAVRPVGPAPNTRPAAKPAAEGPRAAVALAACVVIAFACFLIIMMIYG
jgi:hypothetical protein